jgi:hypothetical protein
MRLMRWLQSPMRSRAGFVKFVIKRVGLAQTHSVEKVCDSWTYSVNTRTTVRKTND